MSKNNKQRKSKGGKQQKTRKRVSLAMQSLGELVSKYGRYSVGLWIAKNTGYTFLEDADFVEGTTLESFKDDIEHVLGEISNQFRDVLVAEGMGLEGLPSEEDCLEMFKTQDGFQMVSSAVGTSLDALMLIFPDQLVSKFKNPDSVRLSLCRRFYLAGLR